MATEVTNICKQIGIPDVNRNVVQKDKIKEAVFNHHYKDLKENINKYKKLDCITVRPMQMLARPRTGINLNRCKPFCSEKCK